ncbi:MAG: beta-Ala-His dipeptidase [Pseudomonadales bacterium]
MKPALYPAEPQHLWEHFYQFSRRPRPSGQEALVRSYVTDLADQQAYRWQQDSAGNLVVYVGASAGMEQRPVVVIQNHLDMVTVQLPDKNHNFSSDPLVLKVDDGWLSADGTTLGADNGLGCAAALAVMTDPDVVHPPLELLFTVNEETGLQGALQLDASMLSGRRMLNLDTEDWGELFIGCAGGVVWEFRRDINTEPVPDGHRGFKLSLEGLAGGHSGIEIHRQLANAAKLLGQWLLEARQLGIRLAAVDVGVAHNVIPRRGSLLLSCPAQSHSDLMALNDRLTGRWKQYLSPADAGLQLTIEAATAEPVLCAEDQQVLERVLLMFPNGAKTYSASQPADLVSLSTNLAVVRVGADEMMLESSLRYFNEAEAQSASVEVLALAETFAMSVEETVAYPGWQPDFDSPLLAQTRQMYQQLFAELPAVKAIHAGLECGILKDKLPAMDTVSFGPTIRGAHSPRECLEIATVAPFWYLLTTLLAQM